MSCSQQQSTGSVGHRALSEPGLVVGTCSKPVPSRAGRAAPRASLCDPSAVLLVDHRDFSFGLVLLKDQEAASNHSGSQQRINHPFQGNTAPGKVCSRWWRKPEPARLTDRNGKQRPTRQPRLYNPSRDTARFFYLSDFLIVSQLPEGN